MRDSYLIRRAWAMPSSKTFSIPPIRELINRYIPPDRGIIVDPFANTSSIANVTNDLDPSMPTMYHMDATEFLRGLESNSADMVLYDPPYSPRQVSEAYKRLDKTVDMTTTQASYWARQKREIARVIRPGGIAITFGWNSGGIGKQYGFDIVEILLVAHGGWHNDTICTVERKIPKIIHPPAK